MRLRAIFTLSIYPLESEKTVFYYRTSPTGGAAERFIKHIARGERRTLDPQVVRMFTSRSAAQRPRNIRSAISILEAQPFSGRRVDDQRELDVVRILRVRDQRWPGHRKQTKPS